LIVADFLRAWLRQWSLYFLQHPVIGRLQVAVVAIKASVENALEEAGELACQNRVSFNRLEIAVRRTGEHFYLPLAMRIVPISMWVDFGREIVDSCPLSSAFFSFFTYNKCGCGYRCVRFQQNFFRGFVEVHNGTGALADNFKVVAIVASIKRQIKPAGAGIVEQIRVLVSLIRNALD
jgi:hypothetical protein